MWFRSKTRNRRNSREHFLDVKLRSSQVRSARARLAALVLGIAFGTVACLFLLWKAGEWVLDELVYQNQAFAIQEVDIQTDGIIATDQLRRWTGIKGDENLLALDLSRVKRDLEMVPLIETASVERILPHTVRIRVVEREPIAQFRLPRRNASGGIEMAVYYLDAGGFVMLPLEPRQRNSTASLAAEAMLPVISGLGSNELQPGRRVENPQIKAALELILAFENSPMGGLVDLKRIDVSSPEVLTVITGQGSEVTFGLVALDQQLRRWRVLFELSQQMNKAIATLDLAVTNNIPARWIEASAVPQASPKLTKPTRRKKHV